MRYKTLAESGLVVPGPGGEMVNVSTCEDAVEQRKKHLPGVMAAERFRDAGASTVLWHRFYFGFEPRSMIQATIRDRRLKKAVRGRARGHEDSVN